MGLFILGLPMETVSGVQLVLRRQTCGIYDICSSGQVAHGTLIKRFFYIHISSFFWRLIQEDDSAININIQVAVS